MKRFPRALLSKVWLAVLRRRLTAAHRRRPLGEGDHPVPGLYVFGDSLSDTGNVHRMVRWLCGPTPTPSPPYAEGRFSSGPNWIDQLAADMQLAAVCAWEGGTNYAHGGAQTGWGLSTLTPLPIIPNVGEQIEFFAGRQRAFGPSSWIVLYGGHNNVIATAQGRGDCPPDEALGHLAGHLDRLYSLGGRNLIVPTLIPLDRTPDARGDKDNVFSPWIDRFNRELSHGIDAFRRDHRDVRVVSPDLGGLMSQILDNPSAYGFTNVDEPCYDAASGKLAGNPAENVWLDECHPTARVHQYLAEHAVQALRS